MMKVSVPSQDDQTRDILQQLLSPWPVLFTSPEDADVVVTYGAEETGKPTVTIPRRTPGFERWLGERGLTDNRRKSLTVQATNDLELVFEPATENVCVSGNSRNEVEASPLLRVDDSTILLPIDIIEEYSLRLNKVSNPRLSTMYRLLTGLPIPYTLAPSGLRAAFLGARAKIGLDPYPCHMDLDALRFLIHGALETAAEGPLDGKTWDGHRYACLVTHDVDSRDGLRRATSLKRLEEGYDLPSAWFVPTERYELDPEVLSALGNHGELGSHGTRHDGRLIYSPGAEVRGRLGSSRRFLEEMAGVKVRGFRAPLLQHSGTILGALKDEGYLYDASIPTWEPMHPPVMGPHGIETVYPMMLHGVVEAPLSAPQDHQMLVGGLNPKQTVERWLGIREMIRGIGGLLTISVHPDCGLADRESLGHYEGLLSEIASDRDAKVILPMECARYLGSHRAELEVQSIPVPSS